MYIKLEYSKLFLKNKTHIYIYLQEINNK